MTSTQGLEVSHALKEQLVLLGTSVSKRKSTILFSRGDSPAGLYLIRSGKVLLALEGANPAFPPRVLGTGSVVGLPASVAGSPYSLSAEVVQDAELIFVPREKFVECLRTNPPLCFEVMDLLSGEISGTRSALKHAPPAHARKH